MFPTNLTTMPHKRAKASIRKANSLKIGYDLPPTEHQARKSRRRSKHSHGTMKGPNEEVPKNMFRILNAEKIRADYRMRKNQAQTPMSSSDISRKLKPTKQAQPSKSESSPKSQGKIQILPGESLYSFNRRVETTLRPQVTAVMRSARNKSTQANAELIKGKAKLEPAEAQSEEKSGGDSSELKPTTSRENLIKEFAPRPSKFPLQATVMEPPSLSLTKSMKKNLTASSNSNRRTPLPISAAQKKSLEIERARVIERYRKLKEERQARL